MNFGRTVLNVYVMLFFVALYLPIVVLVALGFNENKVVYQWTGFTWSNYANLPRIPGYSQAFSASIVIALGTTALSVILGMLAGISAARWTSLRFELLWNAIVLLPLIIPEIIEALSLLLFYKVVGIQNGVPATILGHTVFSVSFVALIVRARMRDFGRSYEEASMVLGASRVYTFFRVLVPLAAPAVIAGAFLAFAASFDDVVKSAFTTSLDSITLPLVVFGQVHRGGVSSSLAALAAVMVAISLTAASLRVTIERRFTRA